jgi:hypothetical protein
LKKKWCIKISITNVEWQTSFFGSSLTIPIMTLVWEVIHLVNSLCSCLNKMSTQSIAFPCIDVMIDIAFLLLK